ncbi:DNA repair protein XRCC4-like isoform X2 [Henckelia pumila]|uniref:DNA repair protein XRCC4-like isoform X2 n=1 Tax=Henckelia pumila TaxID=405737 RepID=UPI003C6E057A
MEAQKYTCVKLELPTDGSKPEPVFVKGTWSPTCFDLSISNGLEAWTCHATEEEVQERASQWDQTVSDYVDLAERFLGFQQPGSVYGFSDAGNGCRREEVVWKTQSFDRLKVEGEKCLAQSEKLSNERLEFESEIYGKFVQVLNSKKAKLRELRGQLSKQATPRQQLEEEEESTDKTETFDEGSDEEPEKDEVSSSKDVRTTSSRGRKRKQ